MNSEPYKYNVFLSYNISDREWIYRELVPRLEQANLTYIDPFIFELGRPRLNEIERAITSSYRTLLLISPMYLESTWKQFEAILDASYGNDIGEWRTIPIIIKSSVLPRRLNMLVHIDLTVEEDSWNRILQALSPKDRDTELDKEIISRGDMDVSKISITSRNERYDVNKTYYHQFDYFRGLLNMKNTMQSKQGSEDYLTFLVLEAQLLELLSRRKKIQQIDDLNKDIGKVVYKLNQLSLDVLGLTFNGFCVNKDDSIHLDTLIAFINNNYYYYISSQPRIKQWYKKEFIDLKALSSKKSLEPNNPVDIIEFIIHFDTQEILLLLGPSGSGKTSILEYITSLAIKQLKNDCHQAKVIPILIDMNRFPLTPNIMSIISRSLGMRPNADHIISVDNILRNQFIRPLILFDSIHEVSSHILPLLLREIQEFRNEYTNTLVVVTARSGVFQGFFPNSITLELQKINTEQVIEYINRNSNIEQIIHGYSISSDFIDILSRPFALNLYTSMPHDRNYNSMLDIVQSHIDHVLQKEVILASIGLDTENLSDLLSRIAFSMNKRHQTLRQRIVIQQDIVEFLNETVVFVNQTPGKIINILTELDIIKISDTDSIQFSHHIYQDYYASLCIQVLYEKRKPLDFIWNDYWWNEAVLFAVEHLENADQLIVSIIPYDIHLAARAASNAKYVSHAVRQTIERILISSLESRFRLTSRAAAESLCLIKTVSTEDTIRELLNSDQAHVRQSAVYALGKLGNVDSVSVIIPCLLHDPDRDVRSVAAYTLQNFRTPDAIEALAEATSDSDWKVNRFSVLSMGIIQDTKTAPILAERVLHDWNSQTVLWSVYGLSCLPTEIAIGALVNIVLRRDSSHIPRWAGWALSGLGKLSPILTTAVPLVKFINRNKQGFINEWLNEDDWASIIHTAGEYLRKISSIGLNSYLSSHSFLQIIDEIINELSKMDNKLLYWLCVGVLDEVKQVIEMTPYLRKMLSDEDTFLSLWAFDAVGELIASDLPILFVDTPLAAYKVARQVSRTFRAELEATLKIDSLIAQLKNGLKYTDRLAAVRLLSDIQAPGSFEPLLDCVINDSNYYVRWGAGVALSRFDKSPERTRILRSKLKQYSSDRALIWWIAYMHEAVLPEEIFEALIKIIIRDDEQLLNQWQNFVKEAGEKYPTISLDQSGHTFIRKWSGYLLGRIAMPEHLPILSAMSESDDQFVRDCSFEAMHNTRKRFYLPKVDNSVS